MEVLLSSVRPDQFMVGKVVGLGSAGLSQMLVWVVSGLVLLQIAPAALDFDGFSLPPAASLVVAALFFVTGYLLFATLYSGLGAVSPTTREAQQLSFIVVGPLIIPVYAFVYIVENPTAPVTKVLTFFPFTAPLVVLQRMGPDAIAWWEVVVSLGILGATAAAALVFIGRLFRAFLLSYGKRPGLRALASAIRRG